jgi:hypothetical protein
MKQKQLYTAPEAELLVVRFEERFLTVSGEGNTLDDAIIDDWGLFDIF